jgi:hypothetical protein
MHVRRLQLNQFKYFEDLELTLDGHPRLVILSGENGTGKSSVIDGISAWRYRQRWGLADPEFFSRGGLAGAGGAVALDFHEPVEDFRKTVYTRTAQRVSVEFGGQGLLASTPLLEEPGPPRSIDLDQRMQEDYQRLVAVSVERMWDPAHAQTPAGDIVSELVGEVARPLDRLLPGLRFDGPINPLQPQSTFRFSKGGIEGYAYKNLSGGEKAVFDLLLDIAVKRDAFSDSIWCIDEPELHVNARIHGPFLEEMLGLLDPRCQLWIATHSAGMLATARRLQRDDPQSVAFIEFSGHDFSSPVRLRPASVSREFWRGQLEVAFGDLAALLAPAKVVLCEGLADARGRPRARFDAACLETIFDREFPDTAFVSVGNADDVLGDRLDIGRSIEALVTGVQVLRVIDRDERSEEQVDELQESGVRVLRYRHIERYLLDAEVLDALCERFGHPESKDDVRNALSDALADSVARGNAQDDYKRAAPHWIATARRTLGITGGGSTTEAFLRDTVAPLITPDMAIYAALQEDVFGEN